MARLSTAEQDNAVKTWRYLRLAMVALVFGLGVAILVERSKAGCFQGSISAYFYTPVRGYFVGALVAIGVCLVSLKGNTPAEDVLLNLAGAFAPVVALVPTPGTGHCASVLYNTRGRDADIANNMTALLVVGGLGLALVLALVREAEPRRVAAPAPIGWLVAFAAWLVGLVVFVAFRKLFVTSAHYTAAILMFGCIYLVVRANAIDTTNDRVRAWYRAVRWGMVAAAVVFGAAGLAGWGYWVLGIEVALITLFAVFWVVQTAELWRQGLR